MPRLLLLFSQNVNHSPEFWRLSGRKSHLCPPKSLKMLLIPRFCCQQYSCVKERNLQIAAKLREFDCNVSNRVIGEIVSFLVLFFFLPLPNTECLIFEQRSCYIKAIHYILYQLKQVRSALSGAWVRQQPATQSRSVWDLWLTESDPPAWTLSQTQQAADTHTRPDAYRSKRIVITAQIYKWTFARNACRQPRACTRRHLLLQTFVSCTGMPFGQAAASDIPLTKSLCSSASAQQCFPTWCLYQQV